MKKIQTALNEIAQKTMLLANLIDDAVKTGVLTQEVANDLAQGMKVKAHLTNSLETMVHWTSKDLNDPAVAEEFQELVDSIRDFLAWIDETTDNLRRVIPEVAAL